MWMGQVRDIPKDSDQKKWPILEFHQIPLAPTESTFLILGHLPPTFVRRPTGGQPSGTRSLGRNTSGAQG